ncbi:MAG: cryptochrome/photolyase family protein [Planctomycetota bacterium]
MTTAFASALRERQPDPADRRWLFVPYDQLHDGLGPLAAEDPDELGIVVVESRAKAQRRPYHKQKLALVLANLRQFCLEQQARGVAVRHVAGAGGYAELLEPVAREFGPLRVMRPAERELRAELEPLVVRHLLDVVPHDGWLTTTADFAASHRNGPPWRMDAFYRHVRKRTGILMQGGGRSAGRPVGGRFSFDVQNRKAWRGEPPAPPPPQFEPDAVTAEVLELVEARFGDHPGELDGASLPSTAADAERVWAWAKAHCLPGFGPFQDAMSTQSSSLFHTRLSPLLNLCRLLPARVVREAVELDLPLASKEGFVRQLLGWREFVRHVHEATDGFRVLPPGLDVDVGDSERSGAAAPSFLDAREPLPAAWWGSASGLRCLDHCVTDVWRTGYGHHITRLMVLSNLAALLDVDPRELTDWFWVAYADAYDWVVEPNVLGMGTFAVGDLMTTKPYVAGAAYIDKMSDYCGGCAFDPARNCPVRALYWAFLDRHKDRLEGNPRLAMPLRSLARRSPAQRREDRAVFEAVRVQLRAGEPVTPEDLSG